MLGCHGLRSRGMLGCHGLRSRGMLAWNARVKCSREFELQRTPKTMDALNSNMLSLRESIAPQQLSCLAYSLAGLSLSNSFHFIARSIGSIRKTISPF